MRALVTGFDPFGGENVNASLEAVRRLPARIGALEVITAELPTSYARALAVLEEAIMGARPEIVLCVGQASERAALCVERVAVNLRDARIADNDGAQPVDLPVVPGGPAAYLATLPVRAAVAALRAAELPAEVSMSAGTFVCNHVFYGLMHLEATGTHRFRGGFLHVPSLAQGAGSGVHTMSLDDIVRGIGIFLVVAAAS
ncbi:MAG: pyroglutamyl-peptidase I [Betaproteobacteria bacterium]|nr:pyroglutamyl-peptidase I [Betaproteobacteria bacterium]